MAKDRSKPPLVDNPHVRELYADDAWFAFEEAKGMLNFTFTVARVGDEKDTETRGRYVAARIALPLQSALALHHRLSELVKYLESKGRVHRIPEYPTTKQ